MGKTLFFWCFFLASNASFGQFKKSEISKDSVLRKWTAAIFCIEVEPNINQVRSDLSVQNIVNDSERTHIENSLREWGYNNRSMGTAIFLENEGRYYLITAAHVLSEPTKYDSMALFTKILLVDNNDSVNNFSKLRFDNHGNVFGDKDVTMLRGTIPFGYKSTNYIISHEKDICIIDLSARDWRFIETLKKRNYAPIKLSDIDTFCTVKEDESIIAFGYPMESRFNSFGDTVKPKPDRLLPRALHNYYSPGVVVPIITYGVIGSITAKKSFNANIFVYHGNSGGPIVRNNKLVGIVSRADFKLANLKGGPSKQYVNFYSLHMKSSLLPSLLRELKAKVANNPRFDYK